MAQTVRKPAGTAALRARKVQELTERCRREGLAITVQRRVILEALVGRRDHPTADQVYDDVRARLPGVSRTTIYRVLETLARIGLASKSCHPGPAVRFDPHTEPHHHLLCVECDTMIDVEVPRLGRLPPPDTRGLDFEVDDYSVYFRGVCAACRSRRPRRRRTAGAAPAEEHGS